MCLGSMDCTLKDARVGNIYVVPSAHIHHRQLQTGYKYTSSVHRVCCRVHEPGGYSTCLALAVAGGDDGARTLETRTCPRAGTFFFLFPGT